MALIALSVFDGEVPVIQDNEVVNPLHIWSVWLGPSPDRLLERLLTNSNLLVAVLVLLAFLVVIVIGAFYHGGTAEGSSAEPSAFQRRLEDMVNLRVSRRPRTRKRRHRHA